MKSSFIFGLVLSLWTSPALAGVCLEADPETDNLSEADREAGLSLLRSSLQERGAELGGDCEETWRVVHIQLGRSVTVTATHDDQVYRMTAEILEDLPRVYSQLAHSMVTGEAPIEGMDRSNVTVDQMEGRRVRAELMTALSFGATAAPSVGGSLAPTINFGMRVELDQWAVDANLRGMLPGGGGNSNHYFGGIGAHLNALRFHDPISNHALYYGAGLGYGGIDWTDGNDSGGGYGFEVRGITGFEMFRASTMRMYIQGDVILPLYDDESELWAPFVGLSLGIAYKPQPSQGQIPWWVLLF